MQSYPNLLSPDLVDSFPFFVNHFHNFVHIPLNPYIHIPSFSWAGPRHGRFGARGHAISGATTTGGSIGTANTTTTYESSSSLLSSDVDSTTFFDSEDESSR
ncbi:unnamed protein product [Protopolystoma xenopodis]|uniref:Uncharacterized protein n=1 Tax=Protopolystoma xenopodis TaxID=117903 RepID=A0A3S5B2U2_9PLAT|nr:unnamed protein product [Protopolystoma xenopodis]